MPAVPDLLRDQLQSTLGAAYTLERELGGGGMSRVFVIGDVRLHRKLVAKVLSPELAAGVSAERFQREIELAASLQQANIVPLLTVGETEGLPYYTMPFVDGLSLRARLERNGALPVGEAISVLRDLTRALAYAHEHGIVHRDIKPENILLSGDAAVVTDFGIAKALAASKTQAPGGTLTQVGTSIGTPAYMAPEQAAGDPATDHRADLYALGCVAYEMLTGAAPFAGRPAHQLFAAHLNETPAPIAHVRPDAPPALTALVMQCLAKDPGARPQSARAALAALDRVSSVAIPSAAAPARRRTRALVAAGLVAVAVGAWLVLGRNQPPGAPTAPGGRSIAVLPLVNVGGDSAQDYFADGMADELATALGKLPGLRVAARTSAYAFKGRRGLDVREVGQKLGVDVVLQGSVRRAGDRLRVSVQLSDAKQGVELWSQTYDRDARDVFAVQDSITQATVRQLALSLGAGSLALTRAGRTTDPEAHDLYLRAQTIATQGTEASLRRAVDLYRQALVKDPDYAQADAAMSFAYMSLADAFMPANVAYDSSRAAARRALARDSLVSDARATAAFASLALDWDFATADRELRSAAARDANSAQTQILYAVYLCTSGRTAEGLVAAKAAMMLDPLNPVGSWSREQCLYFGRRYDQLIAEHARTVAQWPDPRFFYWDSYLAAAYRETGRYAEALAEYERAQQAAGDVPLFGYAVTLARSGRTAEARAALERLLAYGRTHYVNPITAVAVYAALGDRDRAFAWLDRTVTDRTGWLWGIATWPEFDPLQQDPRLRRLTERMRLPAPAGASR